MANSQKLHSLSSRILLGFAGVILLTAAAIGIPSIWLVRNQLTLRAWAQIEQAQLAAEALLDARQTEMQGLAVLTTQRPTLHTLLEMNDPIALSEYLEQLLIGTQAQLIGVCRHEELSVVVGIESPRQICGLTDKNGFQIIENDDEPQVWILSTQDISSANLDNAYVVAGSRLDNAFAQDMHSQLGLDYSLWFMDEPLANSSSTDFIYTARPAPDENGQMIFNSASTQYYADRTTLEGSDIDVEIALDSSQIIAAQNNVLGIMIAGIIVVMGAGLGIGLILANRISQPLQVLADSSAQLSDTNLNTPIKVKSDLREVSQLAAAINLASQNLALTLGELEREKDWSNHLLESIVEGIVTLDYSGKITFFSHGAEQITGWKRDDVLGKPVDLIFPSVENHISLLEAVNHPDSAQKVVVEFPPTGNTATLSITRARLTPSEVGTDEIALVFRDITQEEMMHRLMGQFLANIAHEFRTPLSAVAASTELLMDQASDLSPAELFELLTSLHVSVINLQTLIDNLLESASIEAGRFHVAQHLVELNGIVSEAVMTMAPLLEKYNQTLITDLPSTQVLVLADSRRIVQVLVNLLSNASKYGPSDAEIDLRAVPVENYIQLEVADRGEGIPDAQQQQVFQRFAYPVRKGETTRVGVGLGLSVVKRIVEAHGGQVGVKQRSGGGSIFWFTLPMDSEK